jgi:hypothetical protein
MSAFKLVNGDTKREMRVTFTQAGGALDEEPASVQMRVKTGSGIETRAMTNSGPGEWFYEFLDADFLIFTGGNYATPFLLTWDDGKKATAPTSGQDQIIILAKLT